MVKLGISDIHVPLRMDHSNYVSLLWLIFTLYFV